MNDYTKKCFKLIADLLNEASSEFSNHSCEDYDITVGFTEEEYKKLNKESLDIMGFESVHDGSCQISIIMSLMAAKLIKTVKNS